MSRDQRIPLWLLRPNVHSAIAGALQNLHRRFSMPCNPNSLQPQYSAMGRHALKEMLCAPLAGNIVAGVSVGDNNIRKDKKDIRHRSDKNETSSRGWQYIMPDLRRRDA